VRLEVDLSKTFQVGRAGYLDLRVTLLQATEPVRVQLHVVTGVDDRDVAEDFEFALDAANRDEVASWRFVPQLAGESRIRSLRLALLPQSGAGVAQYWRLRPGVVSFQVEEAGGARAGQITIHGNVYGSLVGQQEASSGVGRTGATSPHPGTWAALPLVSDDGTRWQDAQISLGSVSGLAVLRWQSAGGTEALLVRAAPGSAVAKSQPVIIGRDRDTVDLAVRWMPCRGEDVDPENWQRSRAISRRHLALTLRPAGFTVETLPGTMPACRESHGSWVGLTPGQPIDATALRLRLGGSGKWSAAGLLLAFTGVFDESGQLLAVHITRPENCSSLRYLVLRAPCALGRGGLALGGLPEGLRLVPTPDGVRLEGPPTASAKAGWEFRPVTVDDYREEPR
jgi:hypothetical protein